MENSSITEFGQKLLVGGIAGIFGTTCVYPIDFIKTRLQNNSASTSVRKLPAFIRSIYKQNGIKGFYSGLGANLVGVTPEKAIKLTINDLVRLKLARYTNTREPELPWYCGMVAGAAAGACQIIATTPMEMAKIQLQMLPKTTHKAHFIRKLGISGLYRGFWATFMRDVPFSFVFFPSHALLKNELRSSLVAGIAAGALAAFLVTPMDVVKTRLQTANNPRLKMLQIYRDILNKEGPMAFFKGSFQRCLIVAPLFGISLMVFDAMK